MRILRVFMGSEKCDYCVCYVSKDENGNTCVNETPASLSLAFAGENIEGAEENCLYIVLPKGSKISDGDFLSVGGGKPVFRWNADSEKFDVCVNGILAVSDKAEVWRPIRSAVLTVSDKGSRNERVDTAGPALAGLMLSQGCVAEARAVVPDDVDAIRGAVTKWCSEGINFIAVTGGTGLSERDVTPEALEGIADKKVPGFGEMMRMQTLVYTERAFLTRATAVIQDKTLIVAFPGSERGASQCFEAISGGLRHGVEILAGLDSECGGHKHKH
jgi:molybdopterin adenylyltransferase